jgi:hypothetical protein
VDASSKIPQVAANIVFNLFAGFIRDSFGFKSAGGKIPFSPYRAGGGKVLFARLHVKDTINAGGNKGSEKESGFWPKTLSCDQMTNNRAGDIISIIFTESIQRDFIFTQAKQKTSFSSSIQHLGDYHGKQDRHQPCHPLQRF